MAMCAPPGGEKWSDQRARGALSVLGTNYLSALRAFGVWLGNERAAEKSIRVRWVRVQVSATLGGPPGSAGSNVDSAGRAQGFLPSVGAAGL